MNNRLAVPWIHFILIRIHGSVSWNNGSHTALLPFWNFFWAPSGKFLYQNITQNYNFFKKYLWAYYSCTYIKQKNIIIFKTNDILIILADLYVLPGSISCFHEVDPGPPKWSGSEWIHYTGFMHWITWHWNSFGSWILTSSHRPESVARSLALCQSPFVVLLFTTKDARIS
jgi:hypothetical protein